MAVDWASTSTPSRWEVDWRRVGHRVVLASLLVLAVVTIGRNVLGTGYGFDFRGGIWRAGHDLLARHSPYPAPNARQLLLTGNSFINPPLLAVLAIPFSLLPFGLGVGLWNLGCGAAFFGALMLLGVRDRRAHVLALCSFPFVSSLILGQPDGLLALVAALAWRNRDSSRGALAVGALISLKLLAWPLLLWLLVTRRVKGAVLAFASAAALLALSWTPIAFQGLSSYPRLLAADAQAFANRSHSVVAAAMRLGASERLGAALAIGCAVAVAVAIVLAARGSDQGYFAAAIFAGLLMSPILWSHYLVLLFVPLAISRPRMDRLWLLTGAFWLSPVENAVGWQIVLVLLIVITIAVGAGARSRNDEQ